MSASAAIAHDSAAATYDDVPTRRNCVRTYHTDTCVARFAKTTTTVRRNRSGWARRRTQDTIGTSIASVTRKAASQSATGKYIGHLQGAESGPPTQTVLSDVPLRRSCYRFVAWVWAEQLSIDDRRPLKRAGAGR